MTSLTKYATDKQKEGTKCLTCLLPSGVYKEIIAGRDNGISYATISRWLSDEHDVSIGHSALRQHFAARHAR